MSEPASPPLMSKAVVVRAALRATPLLAVLVGLLAGDAGARPVTVCASLALSIGAATFLERLAVTRGRDRPGSWRCAAEAGLASAFVHTAALANAVWWLHAPGTPVVDRIDDALRGEPGPALVAVLLAGWALAAPSGLLARSEHARWPRPRGTWRDDGSMLRWFTAWSVPAGLLLVAAFLAGEGRTLRGLAFGGGCGFVTWFFLFAFGTFAVIIVAAIDDLAWRVASDGVVPEEGVEASPGGHAGPS